MSEAAKWYVIHTYSGYENKVAQTILKVVETVSFTISFPKSEFLPKW